jgi:hypothetical protein
MGKLPDGQCDIDNRHAYSWGPKSCCELAAAEAKGYAKALEEAQRRLLELAHISRGADGEVCLRLAVKEIAALKEKVKP